MADTVSLRDIVTKQHFEKIAATFEKNFRFKLETNDINGEEIRKFCGAGCHPEFCKLVRTSRTGTNRCKQERIRSLSMAFETGQPYTSICHAGITIVCVPIMDNNMPLGGLFFGKCFCDPYNDATEADILKRLHGLRLPAYRLTQAAEKLPVILARKIHEAAEFLFIHLYQVTRLDPRIIHWQRQKTQQQSEIGEYIQRSKKLGVEQQYPYKSEQKLIGKVKIGDRTGAKEILNSLLGSIMFQNPGDLNVLKARLIELLSVLNRSAVEGGVDINLMLKKNLDYITRVMDIDTQEDLCGWISRALDDFLDSVYNSQDRHKMTRIKPAIDYIEINFDRQLNLTEIAKAAFLSPSRLAHIFKEQMGITVIDYLTNVRIDRAKELLLTTGDNCTKVCYEIGYNNQSYFTRTFKQIVGMTPRKFREENQRKKDIKLPS